MIETFVPGKWKDTIDVNDFVKLNKSPFFQKTNPTPDESIFLNLTNSLEFFIAQNDVIPFDEKLISTTSILETVNQLPLEEKKFSFPFSEGKTFGDLFDETASVGIKNAKKIGLLEGSIGSEIPPLFFPDIRQLPLYGIKRVINEKKLKMKQSDNDFQTTDWIEKRIEINRQIEMLLEFDKQSPKSLKKPAENTLEVLNAFIHIILYSIKENPYITFHLPSLIDFIDIYLEKDIQNGKLDESEASILVGEFFTKLLFIHFSLKRKNINFLIIETVFAAEPSKTTYRFLSFYKSLSKLAFPLLVVTYHDTPQPLKALLDQLIKKRYPIRFLSNRLFDKGQSYSLSHLGFPYHSDEDIILFNKPCDLIKLFYITLNGGKDVEENRNLFPVYQKFLDPDINYAYFLEQFQEVMSVVFTIYSETNNLTMYLSEKYFSHSFRNSFKKFTNYYHYYLNFLQVDELAKLLLEIKHKTGIFKRNSKSFITEVVPGGEFSEEEISDTIREITHLLYKEISKVPFYQYGKPKLNLFLNEPLKEKDAFPYDLIAPEELPVKFTIANQTRFQSYDEILNVNDRDILDVQI